MINMDPEYLRSQRTLTEAEVIERDRSRAQFDWTPAERLEMACSHAEPMASRH